VFGDDESDVVVLLVGTEAANLAFLGEARKDAAPSRIGKRRKDAGDLSPIVKHGFNDLSK